MNKQTPKGSSILTNWFSISCSRDDLGMTIKTLLSDKEILRFEVIYNGLDDVKIAICKEN